MEYFAGDVERITGVQRLRLHHWMKEGFLVPSGQIARGHGTKNIYTREDLYKIALLKKLIESGIHGWAAQALLGYDLRLLWGIHKGRLENLPPLQLCILRRFSADKGVEVMALDNIGEFCQGEVKEPLSTQISWLFGKENYDDAIVINLSKLIDEVDSHI